MEDYHDAWGDEEKNSNDPALVAGELDHSIIRSERAALIARNLSRIPEDYSD